MHPKDKLLWLIEQSGITQARAAELIAQETKRPCSVGLHTAPIGAVPE